MNNFVVKLTTFTLFLRLYQLGQHATKNRAKCSYFPPWLSRSFNLQ